MRSYFPVLFALTLTPAIYAQDLAKARLLEKEGDALGARALLKASATSGPEAQLAYAEFLHRHRDPDARSAYARLLSSIWLAILMVRVASRRPVSVARRISTADARIERSATA